MRLTKLRTTAAVLASVAGLSGVATLAADANATRVSPRPTGNAGLDDYCRQAADLINDAFSQAAREDGDFPEEGQAWWDLAIEMLNAAKDRGCTFTAARKPIRNEVTTHSRVGLILTGDAGTDDFCRHVAAVINGFFATGERDRALGALEQGRQLGCRLVVTLAPNGVTGPRGDIALSPR
jgi:hypothetical protein